jgi:hypothetical protein
MEPETEGTNRVKLVKVSFNLPERELAALKEIAKARSISVTQALRQAIALFAFLADQPARSRFLVELPDGSRREVIFHRDYA